MRKRVLYASNGAKPAQDAGVLLRRFADPQRVEVTVNVCDSVEFSFPQDPWSFGGEWQARAQPAEVAAAELAAFQAAGFKADSRLGSGVPAAQILEQIEKGGYDVALLGAGSTKWLDSLLLGSTSTRVLHASPTSVLIVHRFHDGPDPVRVVLGTDGSADAGYAEEEIIGLADPIKVKVRVVSVAEAVLKVPGLVPEALSPAEVGDFLQVEAKKSADQAAGRLREAGFDAKSESPTGEPVKVILELAKEADLVVCGSRGMGGAGRLLLGSVSDQLARLAPATLVCRKKEKDAR